MNCANSKCGKMDSRHYWTHKHAPGCDRNFWFCNMLEGWARGNHPVKEEILKAMEEAESFINKCSDDDIRDYRLICVPWKSQRMDDNTPPRIGLNQYGGAEWVYAGENEGKSNDPLSLGDPDAAGVAEPDTTSYSVSKMAAYVKGTMKVGKRVYNECVRVAEKKRKLDSEWEQRAVEWRVENEVFYDGEVELFNKRVIDNMWQSRMDQWEAEKRECQRHFEVWRKVKGNGTGVVEGSSEPGEIKDEVDDEHFADIESGNSECECRNNNDECGCHDNDEDDAHGETGDDDVIFDGRK